MSNHKVLTTEKLEGQTKTLVRQAAAKQNPGYRVSSVNVTEKGDEWEIRLDKLPERVSSRTRQAAPPPEFLKEKGDSEDSADDSEDAPKEDAPDDDDSDDSEEKSDDKGGDKKEKVDGDPATKEDPVAAIQAIMDSLQNLLGELGGHAEKLKEKGDKVDEIHELTKGDMGPVDDMGAVPPVPVLDDPAAIGPTPGKPPMPPKRPPVPSGRGAGPGKKPTVGVPAFSKRNTHVVEHPIKDADGEYSLADFVGLVSSDPRFTDYTLVETKVADDKYVGKLALNQ
jgi:hypothetical protein